MSDFNFNLQSFVRDIVSYISYPGDVKRLLSKFIDTSKISIKFDNNFNGLAAINMINHKIVFNPRALVLKVIEANPLSVKDGDLISGSDYYDMKSTYKEFAEMYRDFCALHELGHYLYTDSIKNLKAYALELCPDLPGFLITYVNNVVEDSVIQKKFCMDFNTNYIIKVFKEGIRITQGALPVQSFTSIVKQVEAANISNFELNIKQKLFWFIMKVYNEYDSDVQSMWNHPEYFAWSQETLDAFDTAIRITDTKLRCRYTVGTLCPLIYKDLLVLVNKAGSKTSSAGDLLDQPKLYKSTQSSDESEDEEDDECVNSESPNNSEDTSDSSSSSSSSSSSDEDDEYDEDDESEDSEDSEEESDEEESDEEDSEDTEDSKELDEEDSEDDIEDDIEDEAEAEEDSDEDSNEDSDEDSGEDSNEDTEGDSNAEEESDGDIEEESDGDSEDNSSESSGGEDAAAPSPDDDNDSLTEEEMKDLLEEALKDVSQDFNSESEYDDNLSLDEDVVNSINSNVIYGVSQYFSPSYIKSKPENLVIDIYNEATSVLQRLYTQSDVVVRGLEQGELDEEAIVDYFVEKSLNIYKEEYPAPVGKDILAYFLLDVSGSMAGDKLEFAKQAFEGLMYAFNAVHIQSCLLTFTDDTTLVKPFDLDVPFSNPSELTTALKFITDEGGTDIMGALNFVLNDYYFKDAKYYKIVLIATDGSVDYLDTEIAQAIADNALVFILGLDFSPRQWRDINGLIIKSYSIDEIVTKLPSDIYEEVAKKFFM